MALSDRVAVMNRGAVVQVGTPTEIYQHPAHIFVGGFVGTVAMNLLPVTLRPAGSEVECVLPGGQTAARLRVRGPLPPGGAATLGVRPQHARWAPGPGDGGTPWIPAVVEDRDVVGEDQYLLVRIDGGLLVTVRDHTRAGAELGRRVAIAFDGDEVHLFDGETGVRIPVVASRSVSLVDSVTDQNGGSR